MFCRNVESLLKARSPEANKFTCGRVGVVGGADRMVGAAILCGLAALRVGAGLVDILSTAPNAPWINVVHPELMLDDPREAWDRKQYQALGVGPGLGRTPEAEELVKLALSRIGPHSPATIDADALNLSQPTTFSALPSGTCVLTPHAGEFERLFRVPVTPASRTRVAADASQLTGQVIVLKGPATIVAANGETWINPTGNPGLATAGTGDVLTGMITGFLAQGQNPVDAARLGVYLHGKAADLAVKTMDIRSLTAQDVIRHIGQAIRCLTR